MDLPFLILAIVFITIYISSDNNFIYLKDNGFWCIGRQIFSERQER